MSVAEPGPPDADAPVLELPERVRLRYRKLGRVRFTSQRDLARLMERGVPAHMICALTFTNKAAGEMSERVQHLVKERHLGGKDGARGLVVSTFHSFGLRVLGRERRSLGGAFTIFDISGTQTFRQLIELRSATGGDPPATVRIAIVRLQ